LAERAEPHKGSDGGAEAAGRKAVKPPSPAKGRKRRSPEAARREILQAAETRLRDHGLAGLNVVDVATDCGMSHATVLHHFGNTAGMRRALVAHMTDRLLRDVITTLQRQPVPDPSALLHDLFDALSRGGHAKLLAWLSIGGDTLSEELAEDLSPNDHVQELFAELVPVLARQLPDRPDREQTAKRLILLIAAAAIGYGVAGARLPRLLSMDAADGAAIPDWQGDQISQLIGTGT
jgi:AcrR family transcriptional regulator